MLSQDAIAALVEAAQQGELPDGASRHPARRAQRLRTVDFTRPTKFTNDQERRIKRALEAFCRAASTRMSAEMRAAVELEVINTTQLNWANAHAQLPPTAICGVVEAQPIGTNMLLAVELPLVLSSIDLLLGGSLGAPPRERKLTEIDWALARHFFGTMLAQLEVIFHDIAGLSLELTTLETQLETAQVAPVSEPTLSLTLETRLGRGSSTVVLLIPYSAILPVLPSFSVDEQERFGEDEDLASVVHDALRGVDVVLRAEVAAVEMTVEQVLGLKQGDLLPLGASVASGATLYADATPVSRARPGRSGRHRAVQIIHDGERVMPTDEALVRLAESTAAAAANVLLMFAPDAVVTGHSSVIAADADPFASVPVPGIATNVAYVDGVTGGNVFVMPLQGARRLAAAMMGQEPEEETDADLSELELSAVAEAMNQMMAAAAGATSAVLGTEVEIAPPVTQMLRTAAEAAEAFEAASYATTTTFTVFEQSCRLIQLIPSAFIVRMTRALDELGVDVSAPPEPGAGTVGDERSVIGSSLLDAPLRVWAELGRVELPMGRVVGLPNGAVLELDRAADDPIDIYVNGTRFAIGRLVVGEGDEWAVRIDDILVSSQTASASSTEGEVA